LKQLAQALAIAAFTSIPAVCACHGPPHVIGAGVEDDFRPPAKPTFASARLLASRVARTYPRPRSRKFDEDGEDLLFLASLPLPSRKICSARFEIRVRRRAKGGTSYDFNDFLQIGFAPFGESGDRKSLFRAAMWAGDAPDLIAKTVRIPVPAMELNRFVLLTEAPHYLDILLFGDTTVDYVQLTLRFE